MDAGKRLGVQPVLSPKDMTNPDVEHLGIMAYAANLQWVTPRPPLSDSIAVHLESTSGRVAEPVSLNLLTSNDLEKGKRRCWLTLHTIKCSLFSQIP